MKMEWRFGELRCEFGHYVVRMNREALFDARFISPCECTMVAINRIARVDAFAACEADYDARIAALALANGYVKAEDYEALKAKVTELTDQLTDATDTLDLIEAESACFDGLARSAGYVKLEPGQVIVDKALHELALSMAHKWEQHIEGRVCASQEARDD